MRTYLRITMNNECICWTIPSGLIRIIGDLMEWRDIFDYLLSETTGLADPGPVIQSFFTNGLDHARTQLDAVITVVDVKHVWQHFDSRWRGPEPR
jgi:G3E family GTPase